MIQCDACKSFELFILSIFFIIITKRGVLGSSLYTCTETTYTHYVESKEVDTLTLAAKINDIVILPLPIQAMPVIACQDRLLRPLHVNLS